MTKDIINSEKKKNSSPIFEYLFPEIDILCYLFDTAEDIPDDILDILSLDRELLKKVKILIRSFTEYRQEKKLIQTIQHKAEIIKANEEEGLVLDKVCRVLVLGEGGNDYDKLFQAFGMVTDNKRLTLKYN